MQFAVERASLSLTLGSLTMINGSPPVRAVTHQLAAGFAAPPDFLEALLFRGQ
jgi:hypothetical protein